MLAYATSRLTSLALSLLAASLVVFAVIEVIPGDPAAYMLGLNASEETVAALRAELGLTGSPVERYLAWAGGLLRGDFGTSYTYRVPVADLIAARLMVSLPLAAYALLLSTALALPIGVLAAARRGHPVDFGIMGLTQIGVAVPNFWFAMLLVLWLAIAVPLFPAGGFPGWEGGLWPGIRALTLPAVALALPQASILARVMRSALIETLGQDYIRTARAKGLTEAQAVRRHGLRNALIPVLQTNRRPAPGKADPRAQGGGKGRHHGRCQHIALPGADRRILAAEIHARRQRLGDPPASAFCGTVGAKGPRRECSHLRRDDNQGVTARRRNGATHK